MADTFELYYGAAWHTVPVYTRDQVSITRGRTDESGATPPSSADFTIGDRSGDHNPANPESALFGNASRNTPARITIDSAVRMYGEAASWIPGRSTEPVNGGQGDRWVAVKVTGIRRRLAQGKDPLKSAHQRSMTDVCTAYWPLDEGPGSTIGRIATGTGGDFRKHLLTGENGSIEFGAGDLLPWLEKGVVLTGEVGIRAGGLAITPAASFGLTWVTRGVTGTSQMQFINPDGSGTVASVTCYSSLSEVDVAVMGGSTAASILTEPFTDTAHMWYLQLQESGGNVNWSLFVDNTDTALMTGTTVGVTLDTIGEIRFRMANDPSATMTVSHIGVLTTLTSNIMTEFYGVVGETAATRFGRLCTELGIAYSVLGDDATSTRMGPQYPGTFTEQLDEIERTDDATIVEAIDSAELVLQLGNYRYTKAAALTIDAAAYELAPPSAPALDDLRVHNDVTVKRRDGGDYRMVQETGPNNVQAPEDDPQGVGRVVGPGLTVNCENDLGLRDQASWLLHKGTVDKQRWVTVVVDLIATPSVAIADVGDRIKITGLELTTAPEDADLLVIGTVEYRRPGYRRIEYTTIPYEAFKIASWAADDVTAANAQRRDTGGCETAASFVAGTGTSLQLTTTSGPLWSTDSADYPLNLRIEGVVLEVTAMSGASNPQTATVTQATVNGATKTIPSGSAVSLADPAYYGK